MRKPNRAVHNVQDRKTEEGLWIRSWSKSFELEKVQYHTRSGRLWGSITHRCNSEGALQRECPGYVGCSIGFFDYQEFATWCQEQEGYLNKEINGNYWSLDKDILVPGNKVYGPEFCLFVPSIVNSSFFYSGVIRRNKDLPVGVYLPDKCVRYSMIMNVDGKFIRTGGFETPEDAHKAWQIGKIAELKKLTNIPGLSERLIRAIYDRIFFLQEQFDTGQISTGV